jgi:hypothetical protein
VHLASQQYKPGENMSDHLGKLNGLVNQIRSAGDITIDKLHVVLMLQSIPQNEDWNATVTNLEAYNEDSGAPISAKSY